MNTGDIVVAVSHRMTVNTVHEDKALCDWFDGSELHREWFPLATLKPEEPKEESAYGRVTKAIGAVTLSREEGDKILEYVKGAIHDGYHA